MNLVAKFFAESPGQRPQAIAICVRKRLLRKLSGNADWQGLKYTKK
jgi:hypothetical protein